MAGEGRLATARRRRRERALLAGSGLVDRSWLEAQVGHPLADDDAAVAAYLEDSGLSPHPLFEPDWLDPRRPWVPQGRSALAWYLADPEHRHRSPHPLVSPTRIAEQVPGASAHPAGPLAAWLEHVRADDAALLPSRPGTPAVTLAGLRALAAGALHLPAAPATSAVPRLPTRVSIVLAVGPDAARTVNWARSVGEAAAAGRDVELVAVGGALTRSHRVLAATVAGLYDVRLPLVRADPLDARFAADLGVAASSGARLVLVGPGVVPDAAAALRLAAVLLDPGVALVQPLLVDREDVVLGAGAVVLGASGAPEPFLAGHAAADAEALGRVRIPAALGPVAALTPAAYAALVPGAPAAGRVVLEPAVRFVVPRGIAADQPWTAMPADSMQRSTELLQRVGFEPVAYRRVRDGAHERRVVTESAPRLRWTLDTAARAGAGGETWGDTHFARSLAASLRRLGQHVALDPAAARHRWSRALDDVVLVVRGLDRVPPSPGPVHLLWVISHPDLVSAEEVAGYDGVFAASLSWAAARSAAWGVRVEPLLQCTDPTLFHPARAGPDTGAEVLFVGNSRGVVRPVLAGALAAGADVSVHGVGWGPVLPELTVASRHVENADLGRLYAGAHVVLNDHWADMRRDGFVSNRLFDATACAARVVSDDIAGLAALFGESVRAFEDPAEVAGLLAGVPADFPSYDERLALAARVAAEHSFDHRAATLLDAALTLLQARP